MRSWTIRDRDEPVDVARDDVAIRPSGRDLDRRARKDAVAIRRHDRARRYRRAEREPDRPVRPHRRPVNAPSRGLEALQLGGTEVVPVQLSATAMFVPQEQRARIRIPRGLDLARQIDLEHVLGAAEGIEDQRHPPAFALVPDQHALITSDRAPLQRLQSVPRSIPELCDRRPGAIEDPYRAVACVAVLAVDQREQLLVGGQEPNVRGLAMRIQPAGAALCREIEGRAFGRRPADDREARAKGRVRGVGRTEVRRRAVGAALERLGSPDPELAPVVVVPPPDLVALGIDAWRDAVPGAFRATSHPALP